MKPLLELLTQEEVAQIALYNTHQTINQFFYKNEDCAKVMNFDRFTSVDACNRIERELTPGIHRFHRKQCKINGVTGTGIIRHELTITFEGRTFENNVSFRGYHDLPDMSNSFETIALWIDVYDAAGLVEKRNSHLYNADRIHIIEEGE